MVTAEALSAAEEEWQPDDEERAIERYEQMLAMKAQQGNAYARNQLCQTYLPLVKYAANMYTIHHEIFEDLIQEGMIAITKGIDRYNPEFGIPLAYYLSPLITFAFIDYSRKALAERGISRHDYELMKKVVEIKDLEERKNALAKLESHPDIKQRVPYARLVIDVENGVFQLHGQTNLDVTQLSGSKEFATPIDSIHEQVARRLETQQLKAMVALLPIAEQIVLTHYRGLFGNRPLSLKKIGSKYFKGAGIYKIKSLLVQAEDHIKKIISGESVEISKNRLQKIIKRTSIPANREVLNIVYNELSEVLYDDLSEEEIETVLAYLPSWRELTPDSNGQRYAVLQREIPATLLDENITIDNPNTSRRVIGKKGNQLTILVKKINGSDLQLAIEIEQRFQPIEADDEISIFESLSPRQKEILSLFWHSNKEISARIGMSESTLRSHVSVIQKKLAENIGRDINSGEVAIIGAQHGYVLLDEVPAGKTYSLSPREAIILKNYYHMSYRDSAIELGISTSTFRAHIHNIYSKMGALDRRQAVLMALKDGLI